MRNFKNSKFKTPDNPYSTHTYLLEDGLGMIFSFHIIPTPYLLSYSYFQPPRKFYLAKFDICLLSAKENKKALVQGKETTLFLNIYILNINTVFLPETNKIQKGAWTLIHVH